MFYNSCCTCLASCVVTKQFWVHFICWNTQPWLKQGIDTTTPHWSFVSRKGNWSAERHWNPKIRMPHFSWNYSSFRSNIRSLVKKHQRLWWSIVFIEFNWSNIFVSQECHGNLLQKEEFAFCFSILSRAVVSAPRFPQACFSWWHLNQYLLELSSNLAKFSFIFDLSPQLVKYCNDVVRDRNKNKNDIINSHREGNITNLNKF